MDIVWKIEGQFEIIDVFQNLRRDGKIERPTETESRIVDMKILVKLICHALYNSFVSHSLSIQ
jgi:hypothetical protein